MEASGPGAAWKRRAFWGTEPRVTAQATRPRGGEGGRVAGTISQHWPLMLGHDLWPYCRAHSTKAGPAQGLRSMEWGA